MHGTIRGRPSAAVKIDGHLPAGADKFVQPPRISANRISFGDLARFAFPEKTDAWLSHITGYDSRTCRRWLAGQNEPPAEALGAIMFEIMRRFHQRAD